MAKFTPHYEVYITYENESAAHDEGMPKLNESVKLPAEARTPEGDVAALQAAKAMADSKTVGAEGRVVFKEYCVYITFKKAFGQSDLLATAVRCYSFDSNADYTWAAPHAGRMSYDTVDTVFPPVTDYADDV